jgi:hypothetical protein
MMQKDRSVPLGTIETFGVWSRTLLSDCQRWSIVPSGTDSSLKTLTQHFVLGFYEPDVVKAPVQKNVLKFFGSFWP